MDSTDDKAPLQEDSQPGWCEVSSVVTKDEKTLQQVNQAVATLKTLPPPNGISEPAAIKAYYAIFDGPVRWKAGIRTPQETLIPTRKPSLRFKSRERGTSVAPFQMN